MAKLRILGKNFNGRVIVDTHYRGIMRVSSPSFTLPKYTAKERTILNDAFGELLDARPPSYDGYETNYEVAKKVANIFTQYSESGEKYDLIELTHPFEPTTYRSHFLGYDVVDGFYSIVARIFSKAHQDRLFPWEKAIKKKYSDKLNAALLFDSLMDAFHFYTAVKKGYPPSHFLEIFGVHECLAR